MNADQLIQSLGVELGLPALRFDANGCARLAIEGAPALDFERGENDVLHMYSVLGPLPHDQREAVYAQLLQGNLFGTSTAGASLAIDGVHGEVVMCSRVSTETITAHLFAQQVEAFVSAAETWQGRLADGPKDLRASGAASAARGSSPGMDHFLRG